MPGMSSDRHISLDIEACGEVLLSVGGCYFEPATGEAISEFYVSLSPGTQIRAGLRMDGDAFLWWLEQSDAARAAIKRNRMEPLDALIALHDWSDRKAWVWTYPASFDLPVIERVCRVFKMPCPWNWKRTMCGRTLWNLACAADPAMKKIEGPVPLSEHDALADAKEQARWYAKYMGALRREA